MAVSSCATAFATLLLEGRKHTLSAYKSSSTAEHDERAEGPRSQVKRGDTTIMTFMVTEARVHNLQSVHVPSGEAGESWKSTLAILDTKKITINSSWIPLF